MPQGSSISGEAEIAPDAAFQGENAPFDGAEVTDALHPGGHEGQRHHPAAEHGHNHENRPAGAADALLRLAQRRDQHHQADETQARADGGHDEQGRTADGHLEDQFAQQHQQDDHRGARQETGQALAGQDVRLGDRTDAQPLVGAGGPLADNRDGERRDAAQDAPTGWPAGR